MKKEFDYVPFGDEWAKEVNKWPKAMIIEKLKESLIKNQVAESKYKDLADRYNDLLFTNCD